MKKDYKANADLLLSHSVLKPEEYKENKSLKLDQCLDGCEWLHSSLVLNKRGCMEFPFILAIPKACEAHNLA